MSDTPTGGEFNVPLPGMPVPERRTSKARGPQLPTQSAAGGPLPTTDPQAQGVAWRERAFSFVTGRDARGAASGDRRAQLIAAFGSAQRDPNRPDVRAAAEGLGVSTRSVQRWLTGGGIRPAHAKELADKSRQAMTTKRGRARAARAAGVPSPPRGANAIKINGMQGVVSSTDGNYRDRDTAVQLRPEDAQRMQDLWVEHGEAGVDAFIHEHWDRRFVNEWHFQSINTLEWGTSSHYNDNI